MKAIVVYSVFVLGVFCMLCRPLLANDQHHAARPGTINYVEGQVALSGQPLDANSIGEVALDSGQSLTTQNGKAEILLTPGVIVRLGGSSKTTMISSEPTNTRMSIDQGEAFVEVDEVHPNNDLRVLQQGIAIQLIKMGLYNFNANLHIVRVLDGEAIVEDGQRQIHLKSGEMIDLSLSPLRSKRFDKQEIEAEDLYRWTSLRSAYLADANVDYAPTYSFGGFGWFGDGWYWDPWFGSYTFLPSNGVFYSPFGWGFYSPWCAFGAPYFWGGHYYHHFSPTAYGTWGPEAHYRAPANYGHGMRYASRYSSHGQFGGAKNGGFRGGWHGMFHGSGGFHGGGFHGGGGGGGHK